MKYLKKTSAIVLLGFFLVVSALVTTSVEAQTAGGIQIEDVDIPIRTEVIIPGSGVEFTAEGFLRGRVNDLAQYLDTIYNFLISIVGVIAAAMIMVGGYQYLTAGGDAGRVAAAKKRIGNALIGLTLAMSSFLLLNTINPDLVRLEVPGGLLRKVTTEVNFLPFCENLVKQLGKTIEDVTIAGRDRECGEPGFIVTSVGSATTSATGSAPAPAREANEGEGGRLWCIHRGDHDTTTQGSNRFRFDEVSGGCGYNRETTGEVGRDDKEDVPALCLPDYGITARTLEAEFAEKGAGRMQGRGTCTACWHIENNAGQVRQGYPSLQLACSTWQNIANNGDAQNPSFNIIFKDENGFNLEKSEPGRMYYCGAKAANTMCAMAELDCRSGGASGSAVVEACDEYDEEFIYFCGEGKQEVCYDEELDSYSGGSYTLHLGRICGANPCNAKGKCNTGVVVGLAQAGGSTGGAGRTITQGLTFGLADACDD